jgi:hypothetical protein
MHTGRACLWSKITREMRALGSMVPLFALALLLAWLLSAGRALSFFQSPTTSPLPPTEVPLPTETPVPTEVRPTAPPAEVRPTAPPTEALSVLTPAVPPVEMVAEPTLSATKVVLMPTVQAARPTALPTTELPPSKGVISLWPWILLGFLSLGAISAGVFLLRREAPASEGEE